MAMNPVIKTMAATGEWVTGTHSTPHEMSISTCIHLPKSVGLVAHMTMCNIGLNSAKSSTPLGILIHANCHARMKSN
jgi:hypothetical protein